jgi:hypothetical protein
MLAGPFLSAAALLALGGLFKARRPAPTARALADAGLAALSPLARPLGAVEVVVGICAIASDSRLAAGLVAAFYLGFAGFVALSLFRATPVGDCGCFGETDAPPTAVHLVLDLAAAGVAGAVAIGSGGGLAQALRHQPLGGVPFLVLAAACTGLAYAALTVLPRTLAVAGGERP